ncbi:MAG: hypothetical protein M1488_06460 [Gammaproteobacteria bacterium]|nr:hypothetical protein [Gammaproteobacteria bacterium]
MVDRAARNQLAEAILALASGCISNDEFEDKRLPHTKEDAAIFEVYSNGAWFLYSDLEEQWLIGKHRLSKATKAHIARWVLFLKTDLPYEWPVPTLWQKLGLLAANLVTLGIAGRILARRFRAKGDRDVWPFIRRTDYEAALKHPVYLNAHL